MKTPANKMKPPTTPPAIAPAFDFLGGGVLDGVAVPVGWEFAVDSGASVETSANYAVGNEGTR